MILDKIYAEKCKQLVLDKERIPMERLALKVRNRCKGKKFSQAMIASSEVAIIGEVKKASPSKGIIRESFDVKSIVAEYDASDVNALSILTESVFFLGDKGSLPTAKSITRKPILRKDFIMDVYQVMETNVLGADALLLIVAGLDQKLLKELIRVTEGLGMEALVEVHKKEELDRALDAGAGLIGINNRDLQTFHVNMDTTEELMQDIPGEVVVISESGIDNGSQLRRLQDLGVHGVLIGESFMRAPTIAGQVKKLRGNR